MLSVVMLLLNFIMPQYYYNLVMPSIIKQVALNKSSLLLKIQK